MNSSLCVTNTHRKDAHERQALFSEYPLSEVLFAVTGKTTPMLKIKIKIRATLEKSYQ